MLTLITTVLLTQSTKETLTGKPVEGVFYAPAEATTTKRPAVLVLHGSEGSLQFTDFTAKSLAEEGYPSLALRYFGGENQPKHLEEVPIESLDRAVDWLSKRQEVDRNKIVILGFSRGAELALTYASMNNKIKAAVAIAPSCMRYQGFIDMFTSTSKAAFTYKGKPLSHAVIEFGKKSPAEVYGDSLKAPSDAPQWIQAHNINGPILLFSGQKDVVWPSSILTAKLVEWLKERKFRHEVEWNDYPDAGHVLLAKTNDKFTESLAPTQFGGTKPGVHKAMRDAWPQLIAFLKRHF